VEWDKIIASRIVVYTTLVARLRRVKDSQYYFANILQRGPSQARHVNKDE